MKLDSSSLPLRTNSSFEAFNAFTNQTTTNSLTNHNIHLPTNKKLNDINNLTRNFENQGKKGRGWFGQDKSQSSSIFPTNFLKGSSYSQITQQSQQQQQPQSPSPLPKIHLKTTT